MQQTYVEATEQGVAYKVQAATQIQNSSHVKT